MGGNAVATKYRGSFCLKKQCLIKVENFRRQLTIRKKNRPNIYFMRLWPADAKYDLPCSTEGECSPIDIYYAIFSFKVEVFFFFFFLLSARRELKMSLRPKDFQICPCEGIDLSLILTEQLDSRIIGARDEVMNYTKIESYSCSLTIDQTQ
jgi:hypothetical protein